MNYYLEYIFIENIIVNILLLSIVNIFTKTNTKKINIIVSSFFSSIYTTIILVLNLNLFVIKLLVIIFVVYIAYSPKSFSKYIKLIIYYLFLNYLYLGIIIGITLFFNINIENIILKILVYIISSIILYLLTNFMWKMWKTSIKKDKLTYIININGQEIYCFVDTGNMVKNFEHNLDIIFLDKKWYEILKQKGVLNYIVDTHIHSIIGDSIIPGYIIKNIEVYKNRKKIKVIDKIIISFSNQSINIFNKYSGLIGYNTYLEKLEGVEL